MDTCHLILYIIRHSFRKHTILLEEVPICSVTSADKIQSRQLAADEALKALKKTQYSVLVYSH